jgi:hypothetical protein
MLRSSSLGIILVSGVMVVSGSRRPDRASPEEGYQLAISKFPAYPAKRDDAVGVEGRFDILLVLDPR